MEYKELILITEKITSIYGKEFKKNDIETWYKLIGAWDFKLTMQAIYNISLESPYPPVPAVIRAEYENLKYGKLPEFAEVQIAINDRISNYFGVHGNIKDIEEWESKYPKIIIDVIKEIGFYHIANNKPTNFDKALERQFNKIIKQMKKERLQEITNGKYKEPNRIANS